jgi:hypothetical protein
MLYSYLAAAHHCVWMSFRPWVDHLEEKVERRQREWVRSTALPSDVFHGTLYVLVELPHGELR